MRSGTGIAIYPGSFDPVTNGHMDIIKRAAAFMDKLVVAVLNNSAKAPVFSVEERMEQLKQLTASYDNVEVDSFSGLLVDYAKALKAGVIIRGLRNISDFELEMQMAYINRSIGADIDTFFIPSDVRFLHISSSAVWELDRYGGDFSPMVPPLVFDAIRSRVRKEGGM